MDRSPQPAASGDRLRASRYDPTRWRGPGLRDAAAGPRKIDNAAAGDKMSREQFWFFHPFRVRYSEIDGQGVVFNAHYLTYFDTTITEYFRALGYDQYADAQKTGEDFHVIRSLIEYKAPVRFDWQLDVGARVARIGNSSLAFDLAIFAKDGHEPLVTGEIVWVYTDQKSHRPVPIPTSIRELIATREKHLVA
jgi:acyl-CoA thioester hydrolase